MRQLNSRYLAAHNQPVRCPRWVLEIVCRDGSEIYIPSHDGIPDLPAGLQHVGKIADRGLDGQSQQMQIEQGITSVGSQSVTVVDKHDSIGLLLQGLNNRGSDIRLARARLYQGYRGLSYADYELLWTQEIHDHEFDRGYYRFDCLDRKNRLKRKIMTPRTGRLVETVDGAPNRVVLEPAYKQHNDDYRVDPNLSPSYWRVKSTEEVIAIVRAGNAVPTPDGDPALQLFGTRRGRFTTVETPIDDVVLTDTDSYVELTEVPYVEAHPADLALMLWTGRDIGTTTGMPRHWHAGEVIDTFDLASFAAIKAQAPSLRMMCPPGEKDALSWVQKNIFAPLRWQLIVTPEGTLSLRQAGDTGPEAPHDYTLTLSDFTQPPKIATQNSSLRSSLLVEWNYDFARDGDYLDAEVLISQLSEDKYGESGIRSTQLQSLIPGRDAYAILSSMSEAHQREWAQPRTIINGEVRRRHDIELTDVARVVIEAGDCPSPARDYRYGPPNGVNRSLETHTADYSPFGDTVSLTLFGGGSDVTIVPPPREIVVSDEAVRSVGSPWPYATNITGDLTVAPGVYHVIGDWSLAAGATLTLSAPGTLVLAVTGDLRRDGTIDLTGEGATAGQSGDIGATRSTGGIDLVRRYTCAGDSDQLEQLQSFSWAATQGASVSGARPNLNGWVPRFSDTQISDYPTSLQGTGGAQGGELSHTWVDRCIPGSPFEPNSETQTLAGGAGGAGGGGLVTMSASLSTGPGGRTILNGVDGATGQLFDDGTRWQGASGAGAGGDAGGWLHIALSNTTVPNLVASTDAWRGGSDDIGQRMGNPTGNPGAGEWHSYYDGLTAENLASERVRVVYATEL